MHNAPSLARRLSRYLLQGQLHASICATYIWDPTYGAHRLFYLSKSMKALLVACGARCGHGRWRALMGPSARQPS